MKDQVGRIERGQKGGVFHTPGRQSVSMPPQRMGSVNEERCCEVGFRYPTAC